MTTKIFIEIAKFAAGLALKWIKKEFTPALRRWLRKRLK